MTEPLASIVICTFNRAQLLRCCLNSLAETGDRARRFEILVVDNNSTDETRTVVDSFTAAMPTLRYVQEERQGLSHARNRGLLEAQADWVAYLDDDARVLTGYLHRLERLAENATFDCVAGVYLPWYRDGRKRWYLDTYASNVELSDVLGELPGNAFATGCNCLFRREALRAVDGFSPVLGMNGTGLGYGEETRVQVLLRQKGSRIGFDPEWRIEHFTSLSKQSVRWMLRSAYASGRDSWHAFVQTPTSSALLTVMRKLFTRPVLGFARWLRSGRECRSWQSLVIAVGEPVALTVGQLVGGLGSRNSVSN